MYITLRMNVEASLDELFHDPGTLFLSKFALFGKLLVESSP